MPNYRIIVSQTQYPDYPCMSGYDITAPNSHDAEQEGRRQFSKDTGFAFENTKAYTLDEHQTNYRNEHRSI